MPMSISSEFFKPSRSLPVCPSSLERIHEAIHVSVFDSETYWAKLAIISLSQM